MTLWAMTPDLLGRMEARMSALKVGGLRLWTGALRDVHARQEARRREAAEQLELLAAEVPEASERVARIRALIGPLAMMMICAGALGAVAVATVPGAPDMRRGPAMVRMVRPARRVET